MQQAKTHPLEALAQGAAGLLALPILLGVLVIQMEIGRQVGENGDLAPDMVVAIGQGVSQTAAQVGVLLSPYLRPIIGLYVTIFGILISVAEVIASARRTEFQPFIDRNALRGLVTAGGTLGVGLVACALITVMFGGNRGARRDWALKHAPDWFDGKISFWQYMHDAFAFDFHFFTTWATIVFSTVGAIFVIIAAVQFAWLLGFWWALKLLMSISSALRAILRISASPVPIASIILGVAGLALTFS
jgi:hypothetical protein